MFAKSVVATTVLALAAGVISTEPYTDCTTGPVQCCDSVSSTVTPVISTLLASLGISADGVAVPIGLTCSPIDVIGVGGNSCSAQAVCCENNSFNGIVALGCTPVDLTL